MSLCLKRDKKKKKKKERNLSKRDETPEDQQRSYKLLDDTASDIETLWILSLDRSRREIDLSKGNFKRGSDHGEIVAGSEVEVPD